MNPLLRSCWWSSESQQDSVGSRVWEVGLFLSSWGWNTTFSTGTGELLSLGETWTSHGSILFPLQLMFYIVQRVNRCSQVSLRFLLMRVVRTGEFTPQCGAESCWEPWAVHHVSSLGLPPGHPGCLTGRSISLLFSLGVAVRAVSWCCSCV